MSQENKKDDVKDTSKPEAKPEDQHVGVNIEVQLNGFNGDQPIRAKIDTGAQASSLHGSDIDVSTDDVGGASTVRFTYGEFKYNMPVVSFQAITSSDGGTTNRPVVRIPTRLNGQFLSDATYNLNDRGNMDYPVLIGLDLIKAAKLTIDPSISEMEVTFGPQGFQKVDGQDDADSEGKGAVDISSTPNDNVDDSDSFDQSLVKWITANKHRTLEDVFSDMIGRKKDSPDNEPTK
jgi:hypothetical protein